MLNNNRLTSLANRLQIKYAQDANKMLCCKYLALIRSVFLQHQSNHWRVYGNDFYGNHLLFERIYASAAEDADKIGEKLIGLFGVETIDLSLQAKVIGETLKEFASGDPLETSLAIEKKFLSHSKELYDQLKKTNLLSLGLDDLIMSVASSREAACYLLQQARG